MSWSDANAAKAMIKDLIGKIKALGSSNGIGVFYWEPEAWPGWKGYQMGALDANGRFTSAMEAFSSG